MAFHQHNHTLVLATHGKGFYNFTDQVTAWVRQCKIDTGLLTVFLRHTSASLLIQENADPDVVRDLKNYFERIAPENDPLYHHTIEGPDDMPSHIRTALTATQLSIPVQDGRPVLGTWQGIYLFEHRRAANQRSVVLHLLGE